MRTPLAERRSLWALAAGRGLPVGRFVGDALGRVALAELSHGSSIEGSPERLRGANVLVASERQLPAVLALLQLDGLARRVLLCPPDLPAAYLPSVLAEAEVDFVLCDGTGPAAAGDFIACADHVTPALAWPGGQMQTELVLFTSGTTGRPKLVVHSLASLTGPLDDGMAIAPDAVWSTFYDVRRYGGLQILLRALLGGASMVLSQAGEAVEDFLQRAGEAGVTHISGTPSHWRRALMSGAAGRMRPDYVRLSGEVADQGILDQLALAYPRAQIAHAFASTEAGVAFDVRDGLAGFPAGLIETQSGQAQMRVVDGSLRIRSTRVASRYLGAAAGIADAEGFVDTGDMVELRDGRYFFVGRREGIINVGGAKVRPEEVEAVINRHPCVQMSRVRGRRSPIMGELVVAEIMLRPGHALEEEEILESCRRELADYKVPAMLRVVEALEIAASGKLVRPRA